MKRALNRQKIDEVYQFYLEYGFDHTTDEIVAEMGISKKTFFNRYISKENSVLLAVQHWQTLMQERFREKAVECNHSVEELLMFVWEMHYLKEHENNFFQYAKEHGVFLSPQSPVLSILDTIIKKGIRHYHFNENINIEHYSKFLMYNLSHYVFDNEDKAQNIHYILSPLLTERGVELLEDVDMMLFL